MRIARPHFLLSLILAGQLIFACSYEGADANANSADSSNANISSNSAQSANDNIEELGMLVTLPFEPEDSSWKETTSADGTKKLTAAIRFSDANADKVAAAAAQHRAPVPEKLATESWFPPELISQGDISGESALNGQSYAANDFIRPPYSEGKLIRIENSDYFILELTAR